MELMEAIKGRRSVRKFKPDPIPKEDLEEIIQAGLCAPSAQNLQPWYFVALTKKEDLSYLFSELGNHGIHVGNGRLADYYSGLLEQARLF